MLVNFLIVGTQKGGTTALAQFLSVHPQIYMAPCKEVHFFDFDQSYYLSDKQTVNYDRYHSFFPSYEQQKAVGEATPIYMYFPWIAERIHTYNPNMKLIVMLRHPGERAYSQYQMELARGWEWLPFSLAIRLEPLRLKLQSYNLTERSSLRTHSYLKRGLYTKQIENLLRFFPRQNILFLLSEELKHSHQQTLKRVYQFLDVDDSVNAPPPQAVLSGNYQKPMSKADKAYLQNYFSQEIDKLEAILSIDLSHWRD